LVSGSGRAVEMIAVRTSFACATAVSRRSRVASSSSAQIPATSGAAIEVPLIRT